MLTKTPRKKMTLNLNALKVDTLVMPAAAPIRAVTTSQTCPMNCDTETDPRNTQYCTGDCSGGWC